MFFFSTQNPVISNNFRLISPVEIGCGNSGVVIYSKARHQRREKTEGKQKTVKAKHNSLKHNKHFDKIYVRFQDRIAIIEKRLTLKNKIPAYVKMFKKTFYPLYFVLSGPYDILISFFLLKCVFLISRPRKFLGI